jgi:thiol-disulfide isomerase/thioredoxin
MKRVSAPRFAALGTSLILGAVAMLPRPACADPPAEVAIGATLSDVLLQGLNGPPRRLSSFLGRPLIINVWASWCGPCRAELASLERLAWRDDLGPFTIIGISTDDYPDQAKNLLKLTNSTISHFIDANLQMESLLGASRLPLTVLIDANGRVVEKIYGSRQWDGPTALALIAKAFGVKPPALAKSRS